MTLPRVVARGLQTRRGRRAAQVRYDLEYIRRQSAFEDHRIMVRTVPVMVLRRGGW
ncbi:MAG TPA: hypothetical protein VEL50_10455 [Gemmatimonadales bacterium]|nr:hypothetical protein [Gemmatimonadales bacterium]